MTPDFCMMMHCEQQLQYIHHVSPDRRMFHIDSTGNFFIIILLIIPFNKFFCYFRWIIKNHKANLNNNDSSRQHFNNWVTYYSQFHNNNTNWSVFKINHPVQTDVFNCAIFVINFIELFIKFGCIDFDVKQLFEFRKNVAVKLHQNSILLA